MKKLVDGRDREPNKYTEDMVDIAHEYIDKCETENIKIPTLCGLAITLHVNKDTVLEWSKDDDKKNFSVATKRVATSQEEMLVQKGLNRDFDSATTRLILNNHGYAEKKEIQTTEKPYEGVSDEELARRRRLLLDEVEDEV